MIVQGESLWFSATLWDRPPDQPGAQGVNASTVTLTITRPDGTTSTPSVQNPPTTAGKYGVAFPSTLAGRYVGVWSFIMASGLTAAHTEIFQVSRTDPGGLISLEAAKAHLNIPDADTTQDDEILDWVAGITRVVEDRVGCVLPQTISNERHDGWGFTLSLRQTPVLEVLSIGPWLSGSNVYSSTQWVVDSEVGTVELASGLRWRGPLRVSYRAGRTEVPANIAQAVKIILGHLWETQRGAAQPAFLGGDETTIVPGFGFAVPNRALELLQPDDLGPGVG